LEITGILAIIYLDFFNGCAGTDARF